MDEQIKITSRCPIRTILELVEGKWKLLIIFQLTKTPLRLSQLKRQLPDIREIMLIHELKNLIDSKLIERKNFGEVPPKVEYKLNPIGQKLIPPIKEMQSFAREYERETVD